MNAEETIRKYYQCWLKNHRSEVRSLLADDLKFRSPYENFENADDFIKTCWKFNRDIYNMQIVHEVFGDNGAYVLCKSGDLLTGELLKTDDGKISEIYVTFCPTYE